MIIFFSFPSLSFFLIFGARFIFELEMNSHSSVYFCVDFFLNFAKNYKKSNNVISFKVV